MAFGQVLQNTKKRRYFASFNTFKHTSFVNYDADDLIFPPIQVLRGMLELLLVKDDPSSPKGNWSPLGLRLGALWQTKNSSWEETYVFR